MGAIDEYERPDRYHIAADANLMRISPVEADKRAKQDPAAISSTSNTPAISRCAAARPAG
ncbi:hypothetical protein [Kibdelosporangium philippinense]|uniref:hypothetical protein n=1 Tax=Kibdelosporangium philippinense TaxID=211113 RepID=UPI003611D9B0